MGETATHPIAHFLSRPALLLLLAWNGHAASSRLAGQLKKCTLGRVQLWNLGSSDTLAAYQFAIRIVLSKVDGDKDFTVGCL